MHLRGLVITATLCIWNAATRNNIQMYPYAEPGVT